MHLAAVAAEFGDGRLDVLGLAAGHRELRALAREGLRDAEVDARGAAEHHHVLAGEIEIYLHGSSSKNQAN